MAQLTELKRPGGQSGNPSRPGAIEDRFADKSRDQDVKKGTQLAQKPAQDRSPTRVAAASKTVEKVGATRSTPSRESAKAKETSRRKGNEPSAEKVAADVVDEARTYRRAPEAPVQVPPREVRPSSQRERETSPKEPRGQTQRPPERREAEQPRGSGEVRPSPQRERETSSKEPSGQIRRPPESREAEQPRGSGKGRTPPAEYRRQPPTSRHPESGRGSQRSMGSRSSRERRR